MRYRAEVDGLRSIAIVPVILFHAGMPGIDGGFIGVDIFFVISGFLITTILVQDLEAGTYSIWTFYERRARRILPALFTVVLACVPFAWLWMFPEQLRNFGQSVVATAVFASNILFWKESGYFSSGAELKPLLHTWSLAIEEQYYIVFPILLALAWRFGRKQLFCLVLAIAVVSLGLAQVMSQDNPDLNFYLLPTRAWELMCGGLGAIWMLWRKPAPSHALAALGTLCLLASFVLFDATTPHPSAWTLLPVGGTTLILVFAREGTFVARFLALRPLVAIGLISYSAYLWHQPLFAFARMRSINDPTVALMLSLAALSLVLAALTWKFVEEPFRRHRGRPPVLLPRRTPLLGASAAAIVAAVGIGGALHLMDGAPWRTPEVALRYLSAAHDRNPTRGVCQQNVNSASDLRLPPAETCITGDSAQNRRAVIIGDSHADAIAYPVRKALASEGWEVTQLTTVSCGPVPGTHKRPHDCAAIYDAILGYLKKEEFDLVIAGMRLQRMYATSFDNGEGGRENAAFSEITYQPETLGLTGQETRADLAAAALRQGMSDLLAVGSRVLVVHAIPEAGWNVPQLAAKRAFLLGDLMPSITTARSAYDARAAQGNAVLDAIDNPNLFHVRPADWFCDETRCTVARDGQVYYSDDDHLSLTGGAIIAYAIVSQLPRIERGIDIESADISSSQH